MMLALVLLFVVVVVAVVVVRRRGHAVADASVVILPASDDFTVEIVKEHLIIDLDDDFEIELGDEEEDDFEIEIKEVVQEDKWKERVRRPRLKTHIVIGEEPFFLSQYETDEERLAREFDEQFYGRRAAKRKANYWDLKPIKRRPRDNKEKGDFRQDKRLKAAYQKAVVESRVS